MKIIWAMDPFEDNKDLNIKMTEVLTHLFESSRAEIEPLYLLRENEIVLPTYEVPAWVTDHSKTAESLFKEVLEDYHLSFLQTPHVIPHAAQSHAGAAEVLSDYAVRTKADLIIVGNHGRQGLQRFILGSFAESLLLQSQVPVYVVGSHCKKSQGTKNILFPTEFGDHSKENFRHIIKMAKMLKAEITLFHAIARPIQSLFDLDTRPKVYNYKGRMLTLEQIIENDIEHQNHRAHLWIEWAQKEGVTASFRIDSTFQAVDTLILETIEQENIDLVAMEAQSGPMSAAILGSYTRNIVRNAPCPVYVLTRHFYDIPEDRFMDSPAP